MRQARRRTIERICSRCQTLAGCSEPISSRTLINEHASLQEREHELVLGGEVSVERCGRDAGALDYLADPNCADSALREQLVGGIQNPIASADPLSAARRCVSSMP